MDKQDWGFKPPLGPVKWCKVCGEQHPAREACALVPVLRKAKNGKMVMRLTASKYVEE